MSRTKKKKDPAIGKQIRFSTRHFTVEEMLNEGGFAVIFLVRDERGVKFAMKRIRVSNVDDFRQARFEADTLKSVSRACRFVCRFVDDNLRDLALPPKLAGFGGELAKPIEVMILTEYYPRNVLQLINERLQSASESTRRLRESEVLDIFCDVCSAVAHLHSRRVPIIHRDLKIENILISRHSGATRYVLCDFGSATDRIADPAKDGIAVIKDDLERYTTIAYRSPEMVDLYTMKKITTKADIWALGVMLFKLCFFVDPFNSSLAIESGKYQIPEEHGYRAGLIALIQVCLVPDPDDRPDIYQLASAAFRLHRRPCSLPNSSNSRPLNLTAISNSFEESESVGGDVDDDSVESLRPIRSEPYYIETTSVAPRERPRASNRQNPAVSVVVPPILASDLPSPAMNHPIVQSERVTSGNASTPVDANNRSSTPDHSVADAPTLSFTAPSTSDLFQTQYPDPFSESASQQSSLSRQRSGHRRNKSDTAKVILQQQWAMQQSEATTDSATNNYNPFALVTAKTSSGRAQSLDRVLDVPAPPSALPQTLGAHNPFAIDIGTNFTPVMYAETVKVPAATTATAHGDSAAARYAHLFQAPRKKATNKASAKPVETSASANEQLGKYGYERFDDSDDDSENRQHRRPARQSRQQMPRPMP